MNIYDYIIIGAVLLCLVLAIIFSAKKKGSGCGSSHCEGCAYKDNCNKK